jgi:hypothetical protein
MAAILERPESPDRVPLHAKHASWLNQVEIWLREIEKRLGVDSLYKASRYPAGWPDGRGVPHQLLSEEEILGAGHVREIGDAPAIYWVYGAQLHSFSTWPQFLNAGGKPDLSNVVGLSYISNNGGTLFGAPVQN